MLAEYDAFLDVIKRVSNEANEASQPVKICFGTVTGIAPLTIIVDQKLELSEMQLILTRNVTDFYTDETVDHVVENRGGGSGYASFESHNHNYTGRKSFLIHHKLIVGDKVLLIREQGGQRYIILDRVVIP